MLFAQHSEKVAVVSTTSNISLSLELLHFKTRLAALVTSWMLNVFLLIKPLQMNSRRTAFPYLQIYFNAMQQIFHFTTANKTQIAKLYNASQPASHFVLVHLQLLSSFPLDLPNNFFAPENLRLAASVWKHKVYAWINKILICLDCWGRNGAQKRELGTKCRE